MHKPYLQYKWYIEKKYTAKPEFRKVEKKSNPTHSSTLAEFKHLPLNFDVPHDKKNPLASEKKKFFEDTTSKMY